MSLPNDSDLLALAAALGPDGFSASRRMFDSLGNSSNSAVGTVAGTGVTLGGEFTGSVVKQTVLTLSSVAVATTDVTTDGAFGSVKVYDFPAHVIRILGARTNLTVTAATGIAATAVLVHSLGTVAAATTGILDLTKANIIPSTSTTLSSSAGSPKGVSLSTAIVALTDSSGGTASDTIPAQTGSYVEATQETTVASLAGKINELVARLTLSGNPLGLVINGVSSAPDLYLNFGLVDAGTSANSTITVSGTITIDWMSIASA